MMTNINISTEALKNVEKLIVGFKHEKKYLRSFRRREELLDNMTLAITGMMMLMTELDKQRTIDIIAKHRLIPALNRSIVRLRKNELYSVA